MYMRRCYWLVVFVAITLTTPIQSVLYANEPVTREQLSQVARGLLPEDDKAEIVLRDGRRLRGELIDQNEQEYVLRISSGTITSRRIIPREEVTAISTVTIAAHLANALHAFALAPDESLEPEVYREALALFDEFLTLFPDHSAVPDIRDKRDEFAEEFAYVERGMRKMGGEWFTPVQAAVHEFDRASAEMTKMEERFRGIQTARWNADPAAREHYDTLRDLCRDIARRVPQIMTERLPFLIREERFDEAFLEMNAFLRFWIAEVIQAETRAADRNRIGRGVFEGMDFDYLLRLHRRIMEPYAAMRARQGEQPPANVFIPADVAYIPGGYFFMGNAAAKPDDPDFPFRAVFVEPFLMDRYQVSNAQYREFVEYVRATGDYSMSHPSAPPLKDHTPAGWDYPELSHDKQPVVGVDWFDAYAYLRWRGKRLPTEAEWEMAARGRDGRTYTWGEEPPARTVVNTPAGRAYLASQMDEQVPPPPPPRQRKSWFACQRQPPPPPESLKTVLPAIPWPVDQGLPREAQDPQYDFSRIDPLSMNPYGLFHMTGNAAEWVADWYDPTHYNAVEWENPTGPARGLVRVFRGASYICRDNTQATTFHRRSPDSDALKRGVDRSGKPMIGIRGAQDLAQE